MQRQIGQLYVSIVDTAFSFSANTPQLGDVKIPFGNIRESYRLINSICTNTRETGDEITLLKHAFFTPNLISADCADTQA